METVSAKCRNLSLCFSSLLPLKNRIFFRVSSLVRRDPDTFRYSQERIAKKNAPVNNWHIALSNGVKAILDNSFIIDPVSASCCFSGGSSFLYPLYCLCRINEGFPSSSRRGSGRFAMRKACATQSMEV
jgi:hypothetical protein